MNDYLSFKKMITPLIIQILFWAGVGASVIYGLVTIIQGLTVSHWVGGPVGGVAVLYGLLIMVIGPVISRVVCELLVTFFKMSGSLEEIKNKLDK